ncbi:hypothetical protein NA56DRAFT_711580 [Hyaloscypha hepaticicola]|uniref:Uncharacterized protein n=1 Tax=Hyaloscypha hepaticicola TaxID=2082293 RepID=A0A2J6PIR9_9HELO|nr:hypothetical protein NA56DRAFT_711580 [Hyaloscypha hepaticicola]
MPNRKAHSELFPPVGPFTPPSTALALLLNLYFALSPCFRSLPSVAVKSLVVTNPSQLRPAALLIHPSSLRHRLLISPEHEHEHEHEQLRWCGHRCHPQPSHTAIPRSSIQLESTVL